MLSVITSILISVVVDIEFSGEELPEISAATRLIQSSAWIGEDDEDED